jgi:hypothetical protein
MSFPSEIVDNLNLMRRELSKQKEPASLIIPLQAKLYNNGQSVIHMDEGNFTQSNMEFNQYNADAVNLLNELAYENSNGPTGGAFHLIGSPGLFNVSFRRLAVTHNQYATYIPQEQFTYTLTHYQYSSNDRGTWNETVNYDRAANENVQLFLSSNDKFIVKNLYGSNYEEYYMQSNNSMMITRLSRNPYYVSTHEPWLD